MPIPYRQLTIEQKGAVGRVQQLLLDGLFSSVPSAELIAAEMRAVGLLLEVGLTPDRQDLVFVFEPTEEKA